MGGPAQVDILWQVGNNVCFLFPSHGVSSIQLDDSLTRVPVLGVFIQQHHEGQGVGVAGVHAVLGVREGDELMTTTNFEMKDPVLEVASDEHFPLLSRIEQDSLRMPRFEFYFDIDSVFYSFIVCVEKMHQVRMPNKP